MRKLLLAACLGFFFTASLAQAQQRYVVGILPVYDQSAEELTENLPNGLVMLLFKHLRSSAVIEPVLLSAGGLYDPGSDEWNREFGRKAHVDALLITRIYKPQRVNDHKSRLKVSIQLMDIATGALGPEQTNADVEVNTSDLLAYGKSAVNMLASNTYISSQSSGFWRSSEDFEKQPMGKAARKLADWAIDVMPAALAAQSVKQDGTATPPEGASCEVHFKVRFIAKHSIAKGYTMFANDQDETSTVNDGLATFPMPSGLTVVRLQIPDPPYGVPTQKLYQSSTSVVCDGSPHNLNFDIGPAGEGLLHWE